MTENWEKIHPKFKDPYYKEKWQKEGFNWQETKEWINAGIDVSDYYKASYWEKDGFNPIEAKKWIDVGLNNQNTIFIHYLKKSNFSPQDIIKSKNKNLGEWMDFFYPLETRKEIDKLYVNLEFIEGEKLNIDGQEWPNLKELDFRFNKIIRLELTNLFEVSKIFCNSSGIKKLVIENCPKIINLTVSNSRIKNLDFLNRIKPWKITSISINDNNITDKNLAIFSNFRNLEDLWIGNNSFSGSLKSLQGLFKLNCLQISNNSDIDSDLEYLPDSLEYFFYDGCKEIEKKMIPYKFVKDWKKARKNLVETAEKSKITYLENLLTEREKDLNGIIEKNISLERNLITEKERLENELKELSQKKQLEIDKIKKNSEEKITELNEKVDDLCNELLEIKKSELDKIVNEYKSKLDNNLHAYLDIFLENNSPTAKRQLLKIFDEKSLKELAEKQEAINYLEEKINKLSQQVQIEVLPPSYN
ncbi:MAG: Endonuclease MutS2 [Mycoplasmataceae bacterium]|nr:MAG: Endonuclease MutS2 [Mycoplasmataceae bacterium]